MNFVLMAHSGWRWIVVLLILITLIKALVGWLGKQKWSDLDTRLLFFSRIAVYIQVVLGVILYLLLQGWLHMRFTGEHVIVALLAVGGVEFAAGRAKKVSADAAMFRFTAIGFLIALVLIFLAIAGARTF